MLEFVVGAVLAIVSAIVGAAMVSVKKSDPEVPPDRSVRQHSDEREFFDEQTLDKVHIALSSPDLHLSAAWRNDVITELQNAGILFRERAKTDG